MDAQTISSLWSWCVSRPHIRLKFLTAAITTVPEFNMTDAHPPGWPFTLRPDKAVQTHFTRAFRTINNCENVNIHLFLCIKYFPTLIFPFAPLAHYSSQVFRTTQVQMALTKGNLGWNNCALCEALQIRHTPRASISVASIFSSSQ